MVYFDTIILQRVNNFLLKIFEGYFEDLWYLKTVWFFVKNNLWWLLDLSHVAQQHLLGKGKSSSYPFRQFASNFHNLFQSAIPFFILREGWNGRFSGPPQNISFFTLTTPDEFYFFFSLTPLSTFFFIPFSTPSVHIFSSPVPYPHDDYSLEYLWVPPQMNF